MTFDRVDYSGASPPNLMRPNGGTPAQFGQRSSLGDFAETASPISRAVGDSFTSKTLTQQYRHKATDWGAMDMAASMVDGMTEHEKPLGKKFDKAHQKIGHTSTTERTFGSSGASTANGKEPPKTYSRILHLGSDQVQPNRLGQFGETVRNNLSNFGERIKPGNIKYFFAETSPNEYLRDTVIRGNAEPIKKLVTNAPDRCVGSGLARSAGAGLSGFDIFKHSRDVYRDARQREDGTASSRWNTYKETGTAFGKYAVRDGVGWEAAGVGAALGKAVLPLALGPVSLGGVLVGAGVGLAAQKGMDRMLKTGDRDPVQQKVKAEKAEKKAIKAQQEAQKNSGETNQHPPARGTPPPQTE